MYHNIPQELKQLRQWVCWRHELVNNRQTKVPYCPAAHNLQRASVLNPATWGTFDDAVQQAMSPTMSGIGFVLTEDDPYTGIDIDDKQESPASEAEFQTHAKILNAFQSYTETSVGSRWTDTAGRARGGYHIIIRGKIPGGRDRQHVGVYSTGRYLTFTGDIVRNAPIAEYQALLNALVAEMPHSEYHGELDEVEGHLTDAELHDMALSASNGEKYLALTKGDWAAMGYSSQSEADLALMSIYAFYTRDNAQVRRMFRYTGLGKRPKAVSNDVYINRTLRLIRSKQPNEAELDKARAMVASWAEPEGAATHAEPPPAPTGFPALTGARGAYMPPPGLVGELARYFYSTAVRPLPEAAITAAIGIVAGVAGRTYNISSTGLNQYILFLGKTGTGKEGIAKGISKLLSSVRQNVSMVDDFIGPSAFASGQGLVRTLDAKPCFVSMLGEFGLTLQALSDPRAPSSLTILRKVLLDLYSKSGWDDVLHSTAYSDVEKNTRTVKAPNVTLLAESTPETFYDGISAADIADGLIPRFHVVEYTGKRVPRNRAAGAPPQRELSARFADLCAAALTAFTNNTCSQVLIEPGAQTLLDQFDTDCDAHINNASNGAESQLYNRAHLKALKLAGLLAVGVNPHQPVVTQELARWAIEFTRAGSEQIMARFTTGDLGKGESKQFVDMRNCIEAYFKMPPSTRKTYRIKPELHAAGLVPFSFLIVRVSRMASFAQERMGAAKAIKAVLDTMVETEVLGKLTVEQAKQRFGVRQELYHVGSEWEAGAG